VFEYVAPEVFTAYAKAARALGFAGVASGTYVRSSYRAGEVAGQASASGRFG
jgi:lipoate synthase